MNSRPDLEQKIKDTLDSLDGMQPAEPNPFFYTRLIGRLQREDKTVWEKMGSFLARPAVVVTGLCIIAVLNVFTLMNQGESETSSATYSGFSETNANENEYVVASTSSYEYANIDQQ